MRVRAPLIVPPPSPRTVPETLHRPAPMRDYHDHEDPFESFPEGVVELPDACWDQHRDDPSEAQKRIQKYYKPERQWGDTQRTQITQVGGQPTTLPLGNGGFLLDCKLSWPAVALLRLSSVETSGVLLGPVAALTVNWTVFIGCGRATQVLVFQQEVQPQKALVGVGSVSSTDISLQLPIQAVRVSGTVTDNVGGIVVPTYIVEGTAMIAPFTSYGEIVAR